MFRPPLRDRLVLADKKALLIDRLQATREARAAVLRSRGVEVNEAEEISAARFLWQPDVYDLVMLDLRRYSMEETREFYERDQGCKSPAAIRLPDGPPRYLSRNWPDELAAGDTSRGQWAQTVKRFLAAA